MIKHVFTDVDFSFFGADRIVSQENIDTIKKLKEMGIGFSLQSGRLACALEPILDATSTNHKDDEYMICGNGAIISNTNLKFFFESCLEKSNIKKLLDYFYSLDNLTFNLVTNEVYYCNNPELLEDKTTYFEYIDKDGMYKKANDEKVYKFLVYDEDTAALKRINSKISEITKGEIEGVLSSSFYLEVVNKGVNKGEAIKRFCKLKNIDIKDTLVIGDNYNDETMLKVGGHTACPSNAVKEIKDMVDYVSPLDCDHSAFADIVNHFVFMEEK